MVALAVVASGLFGLLVADPMDPVQQASAGYLLIMIAPSLLLAAWLSNRQRPWGLPLLVGCFGSVLLGGAVAAIQSVFARMKG